jgi:hypothetical protein
MSEDYLDMLEEIEQGHKDDFKWVDQEIIDDFRLIIDYGNELTESQKAAIKNIYNSKRK